jgi:hypothetical protein
VRGGLLLVAAGLSAGAIGELMGVGKEKATLEYLAGGPCILVVAVDKVHLTTSRWWFWTQDLVSFILLSSDARIQRYSTIGSIPRESCY